MGRFPGRLPERQRDDAFSRLGAQRLDARGTRLVVEQPIESLLDKALLPAPNAGLGLPGSSHDRVRAGAIGGQKHYPARQTCFCGVTLHEILRLGRFFAFAAGNSETRTN